MFACFCFYIFQLTIVYCVGICSTCCNAMDLYTSLYTLAQSNTITQNCHLRGTVTDACSIHSQGYTGISVNYTCNIVQFTGKVNFYIVAIVANGDILMIAGILFTAEINGCFRCYLICCATFSGKLPAFIGLFHCALQLCHIDCISILRTCSNVGNLAGNIHITTTRSYSAANRYSSRCCFPSYGFICRILTCQSIITGFTFSSRSNRI